MAARVLRGWRLPRPRPALVALLVLLSVTLATGACHLRWTSPSAAARTAMPGPMAGSSGRTVETYAAIAAGHLASLGACAPADATTLESLLILSVPGHSRTGSIVPSPAPLRPATSGVQVSSWLAPPLGLLAGGAPLG